MPWNNWARVWQVLKPACLEPVLHNKRSHRNEKPPPPLAATRGSPRTATKTQCSQKKKKGVEEEENNKLENSFFPWPIREICDFSDKEYIMFFRYLGISVTCKLSKNSQWLHMIVYIYVYRHVCVYTRTVAQLHKRFLFSYVIIRHYYYLHVSRYSQWMVLSNQFYEYWTCNQLVLHNR